MPDTVACCWPIVPLTRRLVGAMVRRMEVLPVPVGYGAAAGWQAGRRKGRTAGMISFGQEAITKILDTIEDGQDTGTALLARMQGLRNGLY